jgi:hypothetical protein
MSGALVPKMLLESCFASPRANCVATNAAQNLILPLAGSPWAGATVDRGKGNSPAQLKIAQQKGNLIALLTCDGVEETLAIAISAPSTIQLKGFF